MSSVSKPGVAFREHGINRVPHATMKPPMPPPAAPGAALRLNSSEGAARGDTQQAGWDVAVAGVRKVKRDRCRDAVARA